MKELQTRVPSYLEPLIEARCKELGVPLYRYLRHLVYQDLGTPVAKLPEHNEKVELHLREK